jgi:hypothetical protein
VSPHSRKQKKKELEGKKKRGSTRIKIKITNPVEFTPVNPAQSLLSEAHGFLHGHGQLILQCLKRLVRR